MNAKKQKLILENLLSSKDIFARCVNILKPSYFEPELRGAVKFLTEYFEKYNNIPDFRTLNAEFDSLEFQKKEITFAEHTYTCDEVEKFCQQSALYKAIHDSAEDVTSEDNTRFGKVLERVQEALTVSLQRDMGMSLYDNPEERLKKLIDDALYYPTLIKGIDEPLGGGLARKTFTLFSANSGGGKSLMLANIGANYAKQGMHVLLLSLELSEEMIYQRMASIVSSVDTQIWKERIPDISNRIIEHGKGGGSLIIKRINNGATANDVRSYLKFYELEFGRVPDVLVIDYLDLMNPNGGTKNEGVFQQDKLKSEQISEVIYTYDMIGISASQQNREALRNASPDQGVIAGGISKVNTVHNYISMYMDPAMRLKGELIIYFLKTRSAAAVGTSNMLKFNANNLQIGDSISGNSDVYVVSSKKKRLQEELTAAGIGGLGLPGIEPTPVPDEPPIEPEVEEDDEDETVIQQRASTANLGDPDALLKLMECI